MSLKASNLHCAPLLSTPWLIKLFAVIRRRPIFASHLLGFLVFLTSVCSSPAQLGDTRQATGLVRPTNEHLEWMEANTQKALSVNLNELGLSRVNTHLRGRGLAQLQMKVTTHGSEVGTEASSDAKLLTAAGQPALPLAIDNSTLASFPPVRSQGNIGSCAAFSTVYYMGTHMLGLTRQHNNRDNADNTTKLSPKWAYNMVNGGRDDGCWFTDVMQLMLKNGAATWSDFPYTGIAEQPKNYLEWSTDPAVWRQSIANRFEKTGQVQNLDTASGLNILKTLLTDGYVCVFGTNIYGWHFSRVEDDPSTPEDNAFKGEWICSMVTKTNPYGGHAMTVVGYNDNLWVDINHNGRVDPGEKGAFKIVNSYGPDWGNNGFAWISYDALRSTSAVTGAANQYGRELAWWNKTAYYIVAKPAYTPKLLAEFKLNHARRSDIKVGVGWSSLNSKTPAAVSTSGALNFQGGPFAFNGTRTPVAGSFVLDLSDVVQAGFARYHLSVIDNASGYPVDLLDYKLTDASGRALLNPVAGVPIKGDAAALDAYADIAPPPIGLPSLAVDGPRTSVPNGDFTPDTAKGTAFGPATTAGQTIRTTLSLHNIGTAPLHISELYAGSIGRKEPSPFRLASAPSKFIAAGATSSFVLEYAPLAVGTHTGVVEIRSNDPKTSPYRFLLKGTTAFPGEQIPAPSQASGPNLVLANTKYYEYQATAVSNWGHPLQYRFVWGDGSDSGWLAKGTNKATKLWSRPGYFPITVQARCATHSDVTSDYSQKFYVSVFLQETLSAPYSPEENGRVVANVPAVYKTSGSTTNLNRTPRYRFDWGDGTFSEWIADGMSGASKSWANPGTYLVRAQSGIPNEGLFSDFSAPFPVVVTYGLARPELTAPTPDSTIPSTSTTFSWRAAIGATGYRLSVGNSFGASNYYDSGFLDSKILSLCVDRIPTDGSAIYIRLWSYGGGTSAFSDYAFNSSNGGPASQVKIPWRLMAQASVGGLEAVVHNGTRFVAAGENGTVVYSQTGEVWGHINSGTQAKLVGMAVANAGSVYAVGAGGALLYSPDGLNWQSRNSGVTADLSGIAYDSRMTPPLIVVGARGTIRTSSDGTIWTGRDSKCSENLVWISCDGAQWCAVGNNGTIRTSKDGINWVPRASNVTSNLSAVLENRVATGTGGCLLVSGDGGATWTPRRSGTQYWVGGLVHTAQNFIGVAECGVVIASKDGLNWNTVPTPTGQWLSGIAYDRNSGVVVAVGGLGTVLRATSW